MRAVTREIIETIILSLLLFIGIQFAVQTYQVEGASMRPTLSQGQYLLVNKLVYRHLSVGSEAGKRSQGRSLYPEWAHIPLPSAAARRSRHLQLPQRSLKGLRKAHYRHARRYGRNPRWTHLRQRRSA